MGKHLPVWKLIISSLERNIPVMLLYVVESFGSSPGRQGFSMAVNALDEMRGSIGGGIMEHKFAEMAKEKLKRHEEECTVYKQIHDKVSLKYQSGMICSGEQSNLIYTVRARDNSSIQAIINCLENNETGTIILSKNGIDFKEEIPEEDIRDYLQDEDDKDWLYEERIGYRNHLHIIGAGHCALALSKIMRMMDFNIHLYDDRNSLHTFNENEFVHEKKILHNYEELKDIIPSGSYVVVMTVGYRTDDTAVRTLIDKQFKYFGVLGSKNKIQKMFSTYRSEGVDDSILNNIHAPVGMSINSQTPEEIAVSIAAEIIQIKNAALKL